MYLKNGPQQEVIEIQDDKREDEYSLVHEDEHYKFFNTIYTIRKELFNYSEEGCYPLCEYLSHEDLENYVEWVFNNYSE